MLEWGAAGDQHRELRATLDEGRNVAYRARRGEMLEIVQNQQAAILQGRNQRIAQGTDALGSWGDGDGHALSHAVLRMRALLLREMGRIVNARLQKR